MSVPHMCRHNRPTTLSSCMKCHVLNAMAMLPDKQSRLLKFRYVVAVQTLLLISFCVYMCVRDISVDGVHSYVCITRFRDHVE